MTDTTQPAVAGAQPSADADTIDNIIDNAETEPQKPDPEPAEQDNAGKNDDEPEVWSKKQSNAFAHEKGKTAKWRTQAQQERQRNAQLEARLAQIEQKFAPKEAPKEGPPKEADYTSYADYLEAKNAHAIDQKFAERDTKQQTTQQTAEDKRWISERERHVDATARELVKELPDLPALAEEYADIVDDFPPKLQRLFLEADNAPLAFYNLAKEGKIEALASMSLAKAAMEIGRAQTQAATKPKSKAPAPLPAARGSVAPGKNPANMSGDEIRSWMDSE